MSIQQINHFKERNPSETVEFLRSKLAEMGLEVEEQWMDESFVDTFSLRVAFKGTSIGTNGKGCTKEYALASAYSELFERFQNGILCNAMASPRISKKYKFNIGPDEKMMTARELVEQNDPFIKFYMNARDLNDFSVEEKTERFKSVNRLEYLMYENDNTYTCLPFYDVRSGKTYYLPKWTFQKYYGSNGMAAGNTPEEALVQGLSEIIERLVQKRVMQEDVCLPDVPEEYIQKFPYVYEMYKKMQSLKDYTIMIKDCSFGGKYPVAALIIIHKDTGKYGLKMGCHPDFGVAMERAFTEAAQGNDILEYSNRSVIDFTNINVHNADNIGNSFKIGMGQYPYQIFGDKPSYDFTPTKDVSNMGNKEILNQWINEILEDGYDILVRDVSNLGFPSYHIIIPALSELRNENDASVRAENTRALTSLLLSHPSQINKDNCKYIIGCLAYYSNKIMENTLSSFLPDANNLGLPYEDISLGNLYMSSMCYVILGDYNRAVKQMKKIYMNIVERNLGDEKKLDVYSICQYLSAINTLGNHETAMKYIGIMFNSEQCKKIDHIFCEPDKVIVKQYPEIADLIDADEKFKPFRFVDCLNDKLREAKKSHSIDQNHLRDLFIA